MAGIVLPEKKSRGQPEKTAGLRTKVAGLGLKNAGLTNGFFTSATCSGILESGFKGKSHFDRSTRVDNAPTLTIYFIMRQTL